MGENKLKWPVSLSIYAFLQSRQALYLLAAIWVLVQAILYFHYGVKLVPDSLRRYIPFASAISFQNLFLDNYNSRYLGYILFLAFFIKLGLPWSWAVLTQIIISGLAAITLYRLALRISGSKPAGFIATFLFITWKDIQYFNCFILTESLFTSFLIFSFYAIIRVKNLPTFLLAIATIIITCLIRPNGFVVVVGSLAFFLTYWWMQYRQSRIILLGLAVCCSVIGLLILNTWLHHSFDLIGEYLKGEIVYGDPRIAISVPSDIWIPANDTPPLLKIWRFIYHNPGYFMQLAFTKVIYTLGYLKPYHSGLHKVSTILVIYPMYLLTCVAFLKTKIKISYKLFGAAVLFTEVVIIAITVEDWDNRFIIPFIPYFFLFGAITLVWFWSKLALTKKN